ncbi:MAG: hypothetical protein QGH38_03890 [Candidatus Thalassarchaeaceae archaeon]|jgi:hypothetical protein|nr:hypothetical protein [Candidatus Thalassarchaeaceae archaeon]
MTDRLDQATKRLRRLAEGTDEGTSGLSISSMIEAVVGPGYDDDLESLVTMALRANESGMSLDEIAKGILSLEDWRFSHS